MRGNSGSGGDNYQQSGQSHSGRGPKNYQRSDERISEDVCDRLSDDHQLDASNIDVSVSGREVTLSGEVDSKQAKRRAEDCCDSVSGVEHVQNNLRVKKSNSENSSQETSKSKNKS
jgi:osmotically-inducible protein OsmY